MSNGQTSTVVDVVRKPDAETGFPGLFVDQLPRDLWVSPTKIVTSTAWRSRRTVVSIDIESGDVEELTLTSSYPGTTTVLFANHRWILATYSTPTEPWMLFLGQVDFEKNNNKNLKVHFSVLESSKIEKAKGFYQPHSWSIINKIPGQLESLEAILVEPHKSNSAAQQNTAVSGVKPPLVIFPHGGPHSGFAAEFSVLSLVLVSLGFAVACGKLFHIA
jgi:acylaminoacyl-peptidase